MDSFSNIPPLEDRVHDQNVERLRDGAAHLIDVVRTVVRIELDAGAHPLDAVGRGLTMLEGWEAAMGRDARQPPELYAREIETALSDLHERIGAELMWSWIRRPNDRLSGHTPLFALVTHRVRQVAREIEAIPLRDDEPGNESPESEV